jgi:hypothetical protein
VRHIRHVATHVATSGSIPGCLKWGKAKGRDTRKDTPALLADTTLRSGTSLPSERFLKY